jgi:muramidase (phage lysozyme)
MSLIYENQADIYAMSSDDVGDEAQLTDTELLMRLKSGNIVQVWRKCLGAWMSLCEQTGYSGVRDDDQRTAGEVV